MTDDLTVVHAYGLVPGDTASVLPASGIGGAPVSSVTVGALGVIVSELPADRYGAESWRVHGEDPRWLSEVAAEHHAVLQAVVEQGDVLPLRLPGIHDSLAGLRRALEDRSGTYEPALARLRGQVEWGVKVLLVDEARDDRPRSRPTSGRDYLARRASEADQRERARADRQSMVVEAHESLAWSAAQATVSPPQDPALSGRKEPMLLNAGYLVPREGRDSFLTRAYDLGERLAQRGMTLEVTGPWPPYSFADLAGEMTAAGEKR